MASIDHYFHSYLRQSSGSRRNLLSMSTPLCLFLRRQSECLVASWVLTLLIMVSIAFIVGVLQSFNL